MKNTISLSIFFLKSKKDLDRDLADDRTSRMPLASPPEGFRRFGLSPRVRLGRGLLQGFSCHQAMSTWKHNHPGAYRSFDGKPGRLFLLLDMPGRDCTMNGWSKILADVSR